MTHVTGHRVRDEIDPHTTACLPVSLQMCVVSQIFYQALMNVRLALQSAECVPVHVALGI